MYLLLDIQFIFYDHKICITECFSSRNVTLLFSLWKFQLQTTDVDTKAQQGGFLFKQVVLSFPFWPSDFIAIQVGFGKF